MSLKKIASYVKKVNGSDVHMESGFERSSFMTSTTSSDEPVHSRIYLFWRTGMHHVWRPIPRLAIRTAVGAFTF
jgi:hypothetical protein